MKKEFFGFFIGCMCLLLGIMFIINFIAPTFTLSWEKIVGLVLIGISYKLVWVEQQQ